MKKIWLSTILAVLSLTVAAGHALRLEVIADSPAAVFIPLGATEKFTFGTPSWLSDPKLRQRWLWALSPQVDNDEWHDFQLTFKVNCNTTAQFLIRTQKNKGNTDGVIAIRNLSATGTTLRNGSLRNRAAGWERKGDALYAIGEFALVSEKSSLTQKINLQGGNSITISGQYRLGRAADIVPPPEVRPTAFHFSPWELEIDQISGCWLALKHSGKPLLKNPERIPATDIVEEDHGFSSDRDPFKLEKHEFDAAQGVLTLTTANRSWEIAESIRFSPDGKSNRLVREAVFRSKENKPLKFRNFYYNHTMPTRGEYLIPGVFFNSDQGIWGDHSLPGKTWLSFGRLQNLPSASFLNSVHYTNMVLVKPEKNDTLLFFTNPLRDSGTIALRRDSQTTLVSGRIWASGWGEPNKKQHITPMYLEVSDESIRDTLKKRVPALLTDLGILPPVDRPEWVTDATLFGWEFLRHRDARFNDFFAGMSGRIRDLGFNATWLLPVQSGPVSYLPADYYRPEEGLGDWTAYRNGIAGLRKNGIRTLQDIVPHGGWVDYGIGEKVITEYGNILHNRASDPNTSGWNREMERVTEFYMKMGISGFRIDAPGGSTPNWRRPGFPNSPPGVVFYDDRYLVDARKIWKGRFDQAWKELLNRNGGNVPPIEYERASQSGGTIGGAKVCRTIRNAARRIDPEAATLPEAYGMPFTVIGDFSYDVLSPNIAVRMQTMPTGEFVAGLSKWLEEQKLSDSPGALRMRYLVSNDNPMTPAVVGPSAARALTTLFYFIRGIPLVYGGSESGHGKHIRRLNELRRFFPELRRGDALYEEKSGSSPAVFTVSRILDKRAVLGAINFSAVPVALALQLPPELAGAPALYEAFAGKKLPAPSEGRITFTLPPFGQALIADRTPSSDTVRVLPTLPSSTPVRLDVNGRITTARYTLQFDSATGLPAALTAPDGTELAGPPDLLLPPDLSEVSPQRTTERLGDSVRLTMSWKFSGERKLSLIYHCFPERIAVSVRHTLESVQMLQPLRQTTEYQIASAELLLEDWVDPAFAAMPPLRLNFHRRINYFSDPDGALLYDSRLQPPAPDRPELRLFREKYGIALRISGSERIRLFRNFNGSPGIHALLSLPSESGFELRPEAERLIPSADNTFKFGNLRLRAESLYWNIEGPGITARISRRGGVLKELRKTDENKLLLSNQDIILRSGGTIWNAASDYETRLQIHQSNDGLRFEFSGELRNRSKLNVLPLKSRISYLISNDGSFEMSAGAWSAASEWNTAELQFSAIGANGDKLEIPLHASGGGLAALEFRYATLRISNGEIRTSGAEVRMEEPSLSPDDFNQAFRRFSLLRGTTVPILTREEKMENTISGSYRSYPVESNQRIIWEMRYPDPVFRRFLHPVHPSPGSWRLILRLSTENLRNASGSGSVPVLLKLRYSQKNGVPVKKEFSFSLEGTRQGFEKSFDFELPSGVRAPYVELSASPGRGGSILLESIRLEKGKTL